MGRDYYQTLGITRSASAFQIDKAYHKLALKFHPNRSTLIEPVKLSNFDDVAEAYEVLSNPILRTHYDFHGADRLKEGFSDGERMHIGAYRYKKTPENPMYARDVFSNYILKSNPFAELIDSSDKLKQSSMYGYAFGGLRGKKLPGTKDLTVEVPCTLEELYIGGQKTVKYARYKHNPDRRTTHLSYEAKTIVIKPGYEDGTTLKFPKEGHDGLNSPTSDLIFIIKELPHETFTRHKNDLSCTVEISLQDCLDCYPVEVVTLDKRVLMLTMPSVGSPQMAITVPNEGMPFFSSVDPQHTDLGQDRRSRKKGKLQVKLAISMPERIMEEYADELKGMLGSSNK
mmetsp:Transcript_810/g.1748  ORF Transcript_810/g.1748 Transcript_810/m.1748 type:complete len:342 (-) Transcript_810:1619-2644(-)